MLLQYKVILLKLLKICVIHLRTVKLVVVDLNVNVVVVDLNVNVNNNYSNYQTYLLILITVSMELLMM